MQQSFQEFYNFLEDYVLFFEHLAECECEKRAALLSYDPECIDRAMAEQQALLKRMELMEQQREALQTAAGYEGRTFRQIIAGLEGGPRVAMQRLFDRFDQSLQDVKYQNDKALDIARMNLQIFGQAPVETQGVAHGYGANAQARSVSGEANALFDSKI